MSEFISWSLTAGGASGAGVSAAGRVEADATVSVSVTLDAGSAERDLALQVDSVDAVRFLAVSSDRLDGSVTVQPTGAAAATPLTGPILLFGDAVKLFATDLGALKVHNTSATDAAAVSILIGLTV